MSTTGPQPVPADGITPSVLAAFFLGVPLTLTGVFTGIVAATQGHTWPWLPAALVIPGALMTAYGMLRSSRLTFAGWAAVMLAGRDSRRELRRVLRVIRWARHAVPPHLTRTSR
jgi:hypothetical protein